MSLRPPGRDSNSPPTHFPTNTSSLLQSPSRPAFISSSSSSAHDHSSGLVYPSHLPQRHSFQSPTFDPAMARTVLRQASFESPSQPGNLSEGRAPRRGSLSSSSQGDIQDSDMDSGPSSQPEQSSGPRTSDQPTKKKRTRTLTTPHQSAVLHALLAQSRFPTTAMREEVGRQIGLSARKVQIWFQNQRQKARRPHGQNAPPQRLDRPPQFGPFPSVPMPSSPPDEYRGPWSESASSGWHYPQSGMPTTHIDRPSTSGTAHGGLVIPDPHYALHASSPVDRQAPVYVAPGRVVPTSPSVQVPSHHVDPAIREERRLRRERYEDISLPPLHVNPSASSGQPALPLPPSGNILTTSVGPPHMPASPPIPPPFTLEPRPQWRRDPVLPIGPAWRGSNLFGSTRAPSERLRRIEHDQGTNSPSGGH